MKNRLSSRSTHSRRSWRWLLSSMVIIILFIILIWSWRLLHNPHFMPIKNIKLVATYQHIDQQSLAKAITPFVTDNGLFSVDVTALKQALLQQPWIYSVLIKRVWPDQIEIDVTEQQAVALWNQNALLNSQGDEFNPDKKTFPIGLPLLEGPEGQNQFVLEKFIQFNAILAPLNLTITTLTLNSRGSWEMILSNDVMLELGRSDVEERLNRFVDVYPKLFASNEQNVASIDLRYSDGLAVRWREKVTTPNPSVKNN